MQEAGPVALREWEESMTTGIPSVDEQHRRLVAILGQLAAAMEQGRSRAEIGAVLEELSGYTAAHFSHEEACMDRFECPAAQRNAREHQDFVRIVGRFMDDYEANGPTTQLVLRIRDELAWWLDSHIRSVDTQLYPCVRARAG